MQQQAFLFGDVAHNFGETSAPFVAAAGGRSGRIALLLQGGAGTERFVPGYREPWLGLGAAEVVPIWPADGEQLPRGTLDELRRCTAIFIGGGDTITGSTRAVRWGRSSGSGTLRACPSAVSRRER